MPVETYRNTICPFDTALLKQDAYPFYVLRRILQGECELVLTDHQRFVVCYSCAPYPVWVWLPDDATEEELHAVWQLVWQEFLRQGCHKLNMKYPHAAYFMRRAEEIGKAMQIDLNMLTYCCPAPKSPTKFVPGQCRRALPQEADEITEMRRQFYQAIGEATIPLAQHREKIQQLIAAGTMFVWADEGIKAICSYNCADDSASLGNVYTLPEQRRKGYAANLVYAVTQQIRASGKMPLLYTDADYAASNACYTGIGYQPIGSLCTISCAL